MDETSWLAERFEDHRAGAGWVENLGGRAPGGRPRVAFAFTVRGGPIARIELLADPERLRQLDPEVQG